MNARVSGEIGSITKYATLGIALWAISPFALHAFGQAENSPLPLSGPDALVAEFNRNQEIVGLITFPGAGIVGFHGGIEVFDPTLFPSEFIAALISEDENGVPIYEIAVIEDPLTRDRVFFNAHGIPFYSAPAPPDYDPFRFAPPQIEKKAGSLADYDSSRVYVTFDLVDLQDVEALESSSAPETGEVGISGAAAAAGGGGAQSASSSVFSVVSMTCDATNAYVTFPASTQMYYGTQAKIPGTTQGWQYVEILTGEEGMMTCPVTMGTPADPCRNYRVIEQTVSTPIASLTGPDPVIEIEPQLTVTPPSFACVGDLVALELELDPQRDTGLIQLLARSLDVALWEDSQKTMPAGMYYNSAQLPKTVYMECLGPSTGSIELWYREAGQAFCDNHVFTIISVEVKNPVNPNRAVANDSDDFFFRGLSTEPDVDDVKVYYDFLPVGLTATSVKLLLKESETTLREITLTSEPGQNLLAEWDGKDATGSYYDKWDFHAVIEVTVAGIKFTSMEHPIADILFKHRPLVYIHQSEFSGPVDVDIMMDHADLREDVTGTDPTVATAPLDFSDLTGSHDTVNHYQDLDDSYRQSGAGTKTVFCRGTTQGGYVYLQYWHFEPSSSLPDVLTFYHEGDWEMFQIAAKLDTGNENLTPIAVTGGQHFYGQTIRWDSIGNGPTSQDQDYVEKSGHRPKIYVAREGHATYFRDGDFRSPISISTDNHGEQYLPAPTINHIDDETGSLSHNYTLSIFHDNMIPDWKGLWGARLVGPNRNGPPSPALGTTAVVNRWADPKLFNNYYRKLVSYPGGAPAHPETEIP